MSKYETERGQLLAREKALFRYGTALAQGDFEIVTEILAQAETDTALEAMILELNEAEAQAMPVNKEINVIRRRRNGRRLSLLRPTKLHGFWRNGRVWAAGIVTVVIFVFIVFGIQGQQSPSNQQLDFVDVPGNVYSGQRQDLDPNEPPPPIVADGYASLTHEGEAAYRLNYSALNVPEGVQDSVGNGEADASLESPKDQPTPGGNQSGEPAAQPVDRLLIRTGSIALTVEDPPQVRQAVEQRVSEMAAMGAFVVASEERVSREGELPLVQMSIRVPASRFRETMNWLAGTAVPGTSPFRAETADDVTEEYVDLQARLETLETARQRLLEIMADAQRTTDLLDIEEQLTRREAEMEALQGRIQYLEQSAALSLIHIELSPYILSQPIDPTGWRPSETVRTAYESLLDSLQNVANFLIYFGIAVLPWAIVTSAILFGLIRLAQRYINYGVDEDGDEEVLDDDLEPAEA